MIRLLITDDHPIVRYGLRQIVELCPDISDIDEAEDGAELIQKIIKKEYDVILLDLSMPGRSGLCVLEEIKSMKYRAKILLLSVHAEEQYALRALKLGAYGYLNKNSSANEIIAAIRKVAIGEKYISSKIAGQLADYIAITSPLSNEKQSLHETLSSRELQVLCLIGKGKTVTQIAEELTLSSKSISTYRYRLLRKMSLTTTSELIHYAIKEGLIL